MQVTASLEPEDYLGSGGPGGRFERVASAAITGVGLLIFVAMVGPAATNFLTNMSRAVSKGGDVISNPIVWGAAAIGGLLLLGTAAVVWSMIQSVFADIKAPPASMDVRRQMAANGMLGEHKYELGESGLTVTARDGVSWHHWSTFKHCFEDERCIRLRFDSQNGMLLPKSALQGDEQTAEVMRQIKTAMASAPPANGPPPGLALGIGTPRFLIKGHVSRRDAMDQHEWFMAQHMQPGMRNFMRFYQNPLAVIGCALTCGLGGLYRLADFAIDLAAGDIEFGDVGLTQVLGLAFAALLVWGSSTGLLRLFRRTTGLLIGKQFGAKGLRSGEMTFSFTDRGASLSAPRKAERSEWHCFKTLDESRTLFILHANLQHRLVIPKRLFASERQQQDFRDYVNARLRTLSSAPPASSGGRNLPRPPRTFTAANRPAG